MTSPETKTLVREAEQIYQQGLQDQLERSHPDSFVAIEPVSGGYFLGATLSEAIGAARKAHPDRLVHAIRVGHKATVHLGQWGSTAT